MKAPADFPTVSCDRKIRDPRQFDDDGDDTGGLLIDLDGCCEGRGQPFRRSACVVQRRPVLVVGADGFAKPFLIGDGIVGVLDSAGLQPQIVAEYS